MPEPSYDFFATGRAAGATGPDAPTAPDTSVPDVVATPVDRFGAPVAAAAPPAFPVAPGSGYEPGAVNQFGTPIDVVAVPTGPLAAPGIGAAPIAGPGMVSTWGEPVAPARAAHAAPQGARTRPDPVTTAAVVGFVIGGLLLLMAALVLFLYLAFRSQLDAAGVAGPLAGVDQLVSAVTTLLVTLIGICLAGGLLYVLAAAAVIRGRVWGAWTLLVLGSLSTLKALYDVVTSGLPDLSTSYLIGWGLSTGLAVVLVVMLVRPESQRWMRG